VSEDKSQKTEKATSRRRQEARKKGQIPKSTEIGVAASLVTAQLVRRAVVAHSTEVVIEDARHLIGSAGSLPSLETVAGVAAYSFVVAAGPVLAVAVVAGVAAAVSQVGFVITPEAAKPKLSNLSPKRGLERLKPATALWELTRSVLKLGLFTALIWVPVKTAIFDLAGVRAIDRAINDVSTVAWNVLVRAALLAILIGVADYAFNRWKSAKGMRMSKDEIKREYKSNEGDPQVKGQRRRRAAEMSRNRLINVAAADVVVTNPTHFAVALAYDRTEPAPRVVAKGTDRQAKKIRRMAAKHGIPTVENRPLARALYRRVRVGGYVPTALFEATAVVLAEAYRRRGRRPARAA
jgi:flagellar biosynthetic protein FlhB